MVLLILASTCFATTEGSPNIVVSIKPFYNLVAAVTKNSCQLKLLVHGNNSPHDYTLKPSDLQILAQANIIFWGGQNIESFLVKVINKSSKKGSNTEAINLSTLPGIDLLPIRNSVNWEPHKHCNNDAHIENNFDPHLWLSIHNAKIMLNNIAATLGKYDPKNTLLYQANANDFLQRLEQLDKQSKIKLSRVKDKRYVVLHDAYQYFEKNYALSPAGAITLHPEIPPSVKHIQEIRQLMQHEQMQCLFSEPQLQPPFIKTLLKGTKVKIGSLDPIGEDLDMGENGYLILIKKLTDNMFSCLGNLPES